MYLSRFRHAAFALLLLAAAPPSLPAQAPHPEPVGLRTDAPSYAKHGPYWVGTREFMIKTGTAGRTLPATLWYPALNPKGLQEVNTFTYSDTWTYGESPADVVKNVLAIQAHALVDAPPDPSGGPYPLLVFSPGDESSRLLTLFFQEHAASYGFMVLGIDHPTPDRYRLSDVAQALDFAETLTAAGGPFPGLIEVTRAAVAGHGPGGLTALQVGGCRYVDDPIFVDPRVKAVISMATGVGFGGEPDVFDYREASQPTLLLGGTRDDYSHSYPKLKRIYRALPGARKALVFLAGSSYAVFLDSNLPKRYYGLLDVERAHDLINHFTTAFLLDVLKGDQEAHKALLPEAVKFEEVQYTTTWK